MPNSHFHKYGWPTVGIATKGQETPAPLRDLALAMGATALVANLEVLTVAAKAGLPLQRIADVVNESTGRSHVSAVELPSMIRGEATSRIDIPGMLAGMERTLSSAVTARLFLPIMAYARAMLIAAVNVRPTLATVGDLAQVLARFAGVTLQTRPDMPDDASADAPDPRGAVVGYVGLGVMGSALAMQALKVAASVHVHDVCEERTAALVAQGARRAQSLADMARRCDTILVCVPGPEEMRAVLFDQDGLYAGLAPGKIIVDQSTGSPARTRDLAALLHARGVSLVDAPIAGGPKGIEDGAFLSFCGGVARSVRAVQVLLEAMGSRVVDFGGPGNGHAAKLVKNALAIANRYIAYEGLSLASRSALDMNAVSDALRGGPGETFALQRLAEAARTGTPTATIRLALLAKDQELICELGADHRVPMGVANLVRACVAMAAAELGEDANIDEIGTLFGVERWQEPDPI